MTKGGALTEKDLNDLEERKSEGLLNEEGGERGSDPRSSSSSS